MAYEPTKLTNLQALKDTATRIKTEYMAAISKAGHARFQKADAVPEASSAEENVLYLVKNVETNHYDIYALVDGVVELIDDTTVALDDYITEEELAAWSTPMLYWSVDTCDWECRDVQKVFAAICQARDGDVILLHDCYGTSVEAALQAIDCLSEQGVEFVTVEELFALRGQTAEAGHLYRRPE